ncbi:MAG: ABC transporter permease [Synergistaceae bacterium]|nr:ABC transporter permease [Synergistaceae bacterium]
MSDLLLLRRFLIYRWMQNSLAAAVMAVSIALSVVILLLAEGLHGGLVRAANPFPMLMGAKGSPNQLVLNGVFLQDQPICNIGYDQVEKLRLNPNVASAVPLGFGDNYRGYRLVGTEPDIFKISNGIGGGDKPWLTLLGGRTFQDAYEAVIGAEVARGCGLKIGDTFASIHGTVSADGGAAHREKYTVVGILAPLQGPYDGSILVGMESIWLAHSHGEAEEDHARSEVEHHDGREVTEVVIRPAGYAQAMQLPGQYVKDSEVQIVFPSKIVVQLFYIMGNIEQIMRIFSWGVICMALVIIACSLYWFIIGSTRDQAIMRALGATSENVSALNFEMGMALVLCGSVLGMILGHAAFCALVSILQSKTAVYISAGFLPEEAALMAMILLCGAVCSWLPSRLLGRRDIVETL